MLYERVLSVAVGEPGGEAAVLDSVRVSFSVVKTEDTEPNQFDLQVYNLSRSTRSKFETTDNRVILQAGYVSTGLKMLAIGDIVRGSTEFNHPQVVTMVDCRDGGRALRDARASLSFKPNVPAKNMVDELVKLLNVDNVEIDFDLSGTFKNGWSFYGQVRDGLDKLAGRFGFQWSIQNNTLQLTEARTPSSRQAVVLNPDTGMIGSPSRVDKTGDNLTGAKEQPGLKVKCLLNPALVPGDPVVIESREYPRGVYRIVRVEHNGDTHGSDWSSEIQVVESTAAAS